jgi:anti-sigma B factor antagonist
MANLSIKDRQVGGVTVLDLDGKITIGEGSVLLREAVRKLLDEGKKKLLLNLGEVSYVDSSGIGELVSSYTTTNNNGGQLKLLNQTKKIHDLLTITKLVTVFETFDNEEAAVASFK